MTDNFVMPVKAIKNILRKEHDSFMQSLRRELGFSSTLEYYGFLLSSADDMTINRIQDCESYEDLEDFIGESRRMSLEEWINSL